MITWEPTPGQCLCCGGRGGWWSGDFRETCASCHGCGWDPAADEQWFRELVVPLQASPDDESKKLT